MAKTEPYTTDDAIAQMQRILDNVERNNHKPTRLKAKGRDTSNGKDETPFSFQQSDRKRENEEAK